MVGKPCQNPNCKSYGIAHPNCRCYGLAEGGEVEPFCSKENMHDPSCEFFTSDPLHKDPVHSVASYLGAQGLSALLKEDNDDHEKVIRRYNHKVKSGMKDIESGIHGLFEKGKNEIKNDTEKSKDLIHQWIEKGGVEYDLQNHHYEQGSSQNFASGGEVTSNNSLRSSPLANAYPEHNILLNTAKGRISNYLKALKPEDHLPRLAFDEAPDQSKRKKSYDRALDIAHQPLSVLGKIQKGTIEPEHIEHFKNLHPELDGILHKRITEKIVDSQLSGKKPPYHVRQGLSMFMGAPLSGELTPQNIQAAQATFKLPAEGRQGAQAGQPVSKNKRNTSTLTKADDPYLTSNQARVSRQQRQT